MDIEDREEDRFQTNLLIAINNWKSMVIKAFGSKVDTKIPVRITVVEKEKFIVLFYHQD